MQFLTQKIGLIGKKDVGALDLSEVKAERSDLVWRDCQGVDIWADVVSKGLSRLDDACKGLLFLRLEGQGFQLVLPSDELFELGASSIARNLQTPVTDRASVLVVFLDLAASDLETLSVVPRIMSVVQMLLNLDSRLTIRDTIRTQSSCQLQVCGRDRRHPGNCSWCRAPGCVLAKKARPAFSAYHEARNMHHSSL